MRPFEEYRERYECLRMPRDERGILEVVLHSEGDSLRWCVGRNAGQVGDCNLDEIARKRQGIIGVTFRTRTGEEVLICSERFAADLLGAFATGALKSVLDRTFSFARIAEAHTYVRSDTQIGKIALTLGDHTRSSTER